MNINKTQNSRKLPLHLSLDLGPLVKLGQGDLITMVPNKGRITLFHIVQFNP